MNEILFWNLNIEKEKKDRSGIYGYTQRLMAYNSNKIEGSTLTEEQTASLFEEGYISAEDGVYISKDVEEMNGHFLMFNEMLSSMEKDLSEDIIKKFHYELKAGVFIDRANGYAIGDYKKRMNTVNNLTLTKPEDVNEKMKKLLNWYNVQESITLDVLAKFHAKYELIHPFQDGNGRTGRIILFRECIKNNIPPFIIENDNRIQYIEALKKAQTKNEFSELVSLFKQEQVKYKKICDDFKIEERYNERNNSGPVVRQDKKI